MGFVEQFGQARWTEHFEGDPLRSVPLLQLAQELHCYAAERSAAVGRSHHSGIQGGNDVVAGVAAEDLVDGCFGNLLRGDELHLPQGGDGLEFGTREEPVFPGVNEDRAERFPQGAQRGRRLGGEGAAQLQSIAWGQIDPLQGLSAEEHDVVGNALPADDGSGLELLDDGCPGRAPHQEQQQRVSTGNGGFRQ
jgi:hypothetical protein